MGWADLSVVPASITIPTGETEVIDIPVTVATDASYGAIDKLSVQAVSQSASLVFDTDETETRIAMIYDLDDDVDVVDIMLIASRWDTSEGNPFYDAAYDLDRARDIDIMGLMLLASQWGWTR